MAATYLNSKKAGKGIPIGTIIPWSGVLADVPAGWLPCNGNSTYDVEDYPQLYDVIGNTYGGTIGDTFKVPKLNDGTSGAMDIFRGHFYYLQGNGNLEMDKPEKTLIGEDLFWQNVGGSFDGNGPGTTQTTYTSTIDVVGELINDSPSNPGQPLGLTARFEDLVVNEGIFTSVLVPAGRKLSDVHIPNHNHSQNVFSTIGDTTPAYELSGPNATDCGGSRYFDDGLCYLEAECDVNLVRPTTPNLRGTQMKDMANAGIGNEKRGGGNVQQCGFDDFCYDGSQATGYSSGDMYSHRNGTRYFFSGLTPSEARRYEDITFHNHNDLQYEFTTRFIRVQSPGLVQDVRLNTVRINNQTGLNFGTMVFNTATPTLAMIYVIKAF